MKHLLTLVVCALLTVSLIVLAEAATIETTALNAVTLVALMSLPMVLLVASIWAVIGLMIAFSKAAKQKLRSLGKTPRFSKAQSVCPDTAQAAIDYIQERILTEDFLSRVRAGVLCPRCLGYGTEEDGDTSCRTCGNSGCVPLEDGTYGSYGDNTSAAPVKKDWQVVRGPDVKKRLPKGALRPDGDCWNDVAEALQCFKSNRWITASDIAAAAGDGSYTNAQVNLVLGRMAEFNIVTTGGVRRSKKYCVTDQWLRDVSRWC